MSANIRGLREFKRNLNTVVNGLGPVSYKKALIRGLIIIEGESMRRTPVDTGKLRSSAAGNSRITQIKNSGAKGIVFYTANYAIYVHERTELKHTNGEAKFLQNAISAVMGQIRKDLVSTFKINLFGFKGFKLKK